MVAHWIVHFTGAWLAAAGGISGAFISGAFSVIVGFSSKTAAIAQEATRLRQYLGLNTLAAIAAAIFAPSPSIRARQNIRRGRSP